MAQINENYLNLKDSYLFSTIAKKVIEFKSNNPEKDIIKLGIGDVTRPIVPNIIEAAHKAINEMGQKDTFRGYGQEQGYEFLRDKIALWDYEKRGVNLSIEEIFVSDGAKSDTGNIGDILGSNNIVAIPDPVYPVYLDTNIMAGRKVILIPCKEENSFIPELPKQKVDIIYLCFPNNPTGTVIKREELKKWVDYAKENKSIILYDAAYEYFINEENVAHTIYEIEGAKEVAIEFKSFSKTAGFTGLRCAYTVVPKELYGYTSNYEKVSLNNLWKRRQGTKFNEVSYITQRAAEAIYSEVGQQQINADISYYMENAKIIKEGLEEVGIRVFGGISAPYIWLKVPNGYTSWEFFDKLLNEVYVVGTPGVGFGSQGEGYFRLTAFNTKENTIEAIKRIEESLKL